MQLSEIIDLATAGTTINFEECLNESKAVANPMSDLIDSIMESGDAAKVEDLKKLYAAAQKIAQAKGLLPKLSATATAIAADTVFTRVQLAIDNLPVDEVAEVIADKAATYIEMIAKKVATTENIKLGLNVLINVVKKKWPAAEAVRPYADKFAEWVGPKIQSAITESTPKIKKAISTVAKSIGHKLTASVSKASKAIARIFSLA